MRLRAATRGSDLARWQTDHVADLLRAVHPDVEVEPVVVRTAGDRDRTSQIWELGGKGIFVKEVQAAVLEGQADLAVHSAKDLPSRPTDRLTLAAVPPRADPRDALVGARLADLPPGARIGTGSVRRRAQLAWLRPDLTFSGLRGNLPTRVAKAGGDLDAIVAAAAALDRLGLPERGTGGAGPAPVVDLLDPGDFIPQVGQGALAIECRSDAEEVRELMAAVEDTGSRRIVDAERAFLAELGGDCDLPAGAHAVVDDVTGEVMLDAMLATLDGHVLVRTRRRGDDGVALGAAAARYLLDDAGGSSLLLT